MKEKATFYHAGCPVCVEAEKGVAEALDPQKYDLEIVHLGKRSDLIDQAESSGVKSVPALVLGGASYHINHGAGLSALK